MKKILWILGQYNSRHVIKHVTLKFIFKKLEKRKRSEYEHMILESVFKWDGSIVLEHQRQCP